MEDNSHKKYFFKNNQNQEIEIDLSIKNDKLSLTTQTNVTILNKKIYSSIYSLDEIKEKNKFFFLSQSLNDIINQIEILLKENKSNFKIAQNSLILSIPTNMALAPEIVFELKEITHIKIEDLNNYINNADKNMDNNFALILKENKEMKEKICNLEKQINILNLNLGFIPYYYFDKIKEWIGGDKEKIEFNLIFRLKEDEKDYNRFHELCNVSAPVIFIFVTEKMNIFGSYCPYFSTSGSWINDSNAFLFSLNLDKKYPAKKAYQNYHRGTCGYHFQDITYCGFNDKKGNFNTSGTYIDKYELDGNSNYFYIRQFLVYKIDKR